MATSLRQTLPLLVAAVLILLASTACGSAVSQVGPTPTVVKTNLVISGSGGTINVLKLLVADYEKTHGDLSFEFLSGAGSSGAIQGLQAGQLDLAAMGRSLKDAETAAGVAYLEFGVDKIIVATSADLNITGLTSQQVKDIFTGKITNWSAVGGPDAPISVFARDEDDPGTAVLRDGIFGDAAFGPAAVIQTSGNNIQAAMTHSTNAIGYLTYSGTRLENLSVHILILDGLGPTDPGYPYTRPLGVAYMSTNAAKVQSFLDYLASAEAQAALKEYGLSK